MHVKLPTVVMLLFTLNYNMASPVNPRDTDFETIRQQIIENFDTVPQASPSKHPLHDLFPRIYNRAILITLGFDILISYNYFYFSRISSPNC